MVIRDSFGREQRIKYPFYFTDLLLKKGLHEYSYNVGFLRERFGSESNSYSDRVFSAFHRYGVSDLLTVGVRTEGTTKGLYNFGPQLAYNIYNSGILTLSLSESKNDADKSGFAWSLDYGYQGKRLSTRFMTRSFTENYTTISSGLSTEKQRPNMPLGLDTGQQILAIYLLTSSPQLNTPGRISRRLRWDIRGTCPSSFQDISPLEISGNKRPIMTSLWD